MKKQQRQNAAGQADLKAAYEAERGRYPTLRLPRAISKPLSSTAKKYGIDFALKKDTTENPPRYLVFFKGRDADVLTAAFKEFSAKKLTQEQKALYPKGAFLF
ncbi:MAG: PcfB family protein [Eubacterium sp.]